MSKSRWKKKPEKAAKAAKARLFGWSSARPVNAREANCKLREARLERLQASAEPMEPIKNTKVCPAWYRKPRASNPKPKTNLQPQES